MPKLIALGSRWKVDQQRGFPWDLRGRTARIRGEYSRRPFGSLLNRPNSARWKKRICELHLARWTA